MRFGVYILVVMLFLGFAVGKAAATLVVYNTSVVAPGQRISIAVFWSGSPPEPDSYSYSIKKPDGSSIPAHSSQGTSSPGNFNIIYTAPSDYTGNLTLKVTVSWTDGRSVSQSFNIRVGAEKVTVSINSSTYEVESGGTINLSASATTSASGATISSYRWSATSGSFNTNSGSSVTWTAPTVVTEKLTPSSRPTVSVRATDSEGNFSQKSIFISVSAKKPDPPDPPTVDISITPDVREVESGGTVNLSASASTSVSGASISSYSWSATHGSFNTTSGSSVTWTAPTVTERSTPSITARATDSEGNNGETTISISVLVKPDTPDTPDTPSTNPPTTSEPNAVTPPVTPNKKPTVSITASETEVYPNEMVQLTAEANDSDGDIISYQWTANAGSFSSINESETIWVAPDTIGTVSITVVVQDNENETANAIADINIIARPPEPTTLKYISGNNQSGLIESTLAEPFVVKVYDQYTDPMKDITVTFAIIHGAGALSHESVDTDENGLAQSMLTLSSIPTTVMIEASIAEIAQSVTFEAASTILEFDLMLQAGLNLVHVPLDIRMVNEEAATVLSLGDLYNILGGENVINFFVVYNSQTGEWISFFSPDDIAARGDMLLTEDIGIMTHLKSEVNIRLGGKPLGSDGRSVVQLNPGLNLVGLPLRDSRIVRVSDLFAVDSPKDSIIAIITVDDGEFMLVGRTGDRGDIEITGGQAFIMTAQRAATVAISGEGWTNPPRTAAAPPMLTGIQVIDTTPVLALRGAVVDEGTSLKVSNFRVTVKNLSTGKSVTGMIKGDDRVGYRVTVVDIETMRAATVGDLLEIVAKSPDPSVGIQPLRYTVTAEDVKRSYIQLPDLVAYEIPAETELLSNYPNPFNPETWIPYRLAEDAFVKLTIYDGTGQVVRSLDVGHQVAAVYESRSKAIYWDGRNDFGESVASGLYFYHLSAGDYSATRRMVILK